MLVSLFVKLTMVVVVKANRSVTRTERAPLLLLLLLLILLLQLLLLLNREGRAPLLLARASSLPEATDGLVLLQLLLWWLFSLFCYEDLYFQ